MSYLLWLIRPLQRFLFPQRQVTLQIKVDEGINCPINHAKNIQYDQVKIGIIAGSNFSSA